MPVLAGLVFAANGGPAGAAPAPSLEITADPAEAHAAISPFLYGQFIEHMGRCIRDGIWAEKLYDRKFLQEPGKAWREVRPEGADFEAFLDPAGAYAAPHAMALWARDTKGLPCGIAQDGIGIVSGQEYVGYAVVRRAEGAGRVTVRLNWGTGAADGHSVALSSVDGVYRKIPFRFRAGGTTDAATLSVTLTEPGYVWLAGLSLMPANHVNGLRADTLALLKQLNAPLYRWPGGNFVSGYHWKDGIGDRDRRPPRWERAWNAVEDNDFGLDEFIAFCREVRAEPLVVVNTGLGSVEEAVEQIEYVNGSEKTRWGAGRAKNGHKKPYNVVWWGVGNEMFGDWQLGHIPVERYAVRHNAFVDAMRKADPRIQVVGVGEPGRWNDAVVDRTAAHTDLLSAHHYTERRLLAPFSPQDAEAYRANFVAYSDTIAAAVRRMVADLKQRQTGKNAAVDRLRLAIDEYGIVRDWNPMPDTPGVGIFEHYFPLGDAVTVARSLHEMIRETESIGMACWPQTVNVIGAIKTSRTAAAMDPVGHLLTLYRARMGGNATPVAVAGEGPLDAVAAYDRDKRLLSFGLINYSPTESLSVALQAPNAAAAGAWRIHAEDIGAINVPGQPEAVCVRSLAAPAPGDALTLPAHSITVVQYRVRP